MAMVSISRDLKSSFDRPVSGGFLDGFLEGIAEKTKKDLPPYARPLFLRCKAAPEEEGGDEEEEEKVKQIHHTPLSQSSSSSYSFLTSPTYYSFVTSIPQSPCSLKQQQQLHQHRQQREWQVQVQWEGCGYQNDGDV
jgi:hypothetical protein